MAVVAAAVFTVSVNVKTVKTEELLQEAPLRSLLLLAHVSLKVAKRELRVPPTIALLTVAGGAVQWKAAAEARAIRYS